MKNLFSLDSPAMRFFGEVFDLIVLNIITVVCCLPVFTAGAAMTAMHYVLFHKVNHQDEGVVKPFFKSFRENFVQATIIWLVILAAAALVVADIRIRNVSPESFLGQGIGTFLLLPIIVIVCVFIYVFPILSRFANTTLRTVANALVAALIYFPRTILMAAVLGSYVLALWNFPLRLTPLLILFGFVFPWYICALLYKKPLLDMEEKAVGAKEDAAEGKEEDTIEDQTEEE